MRPRRSVAMLVLLCSALAACDGGSGPGPTPTPTPTNSPPVANAGPDQNLFVSNTVTLDGRSSTDANGDTLTYAWTLTRPSGSTAALSSSTVVQPTFAADLPGIYTASLTVSDGKATSTADEVKITIPDPWSSLPPMPTPRLNVSTVALGTKIYVIGGENVIGGGKADKVEAYDTVTKTWATLAWLPVRRSLMMSVTVNGKIYVIGGYEQDFRESARVDEYDPATDSWTNKAPLNLGRSSAAIGVLGTKIYVAGGYRQVGCPVDFVCRARNAVESYDPATNVWTTRANLPVQLAYPGSGVASGTFYVFGGEAPGGGIAIGHSSLDTFRYDVASDSWTTLATMPASGARTGTASSGSIYAFNGKTLKYDPTANNWVTEAAPLPAALIGSGLYGYSSPIELGGKIYFVSKDQILVYDPTLDRP